MHSKQLQHVDIRWLTLSMHIVVARVIPMLQNFALTLLGFNLELLYSSISFSYHYCLCSQSIVIKLMLCILFVILSNPLKLRANNIAWCVILIVLISRYTISIVISDVTVLPKHANSQIYKEQFCCVVAIWLFYSNPYCATAYNFSANG